jgi:hypothetical protein
MPSSPNYKRDYKQEYKDHHSSPQAKKDRAARNKAARAKGQPGKDVDHKVPLRSGGSKALSNTRVRSVSSNRSANGHKPGEKQKKACTCNHK